MKKKSGEWNIKRVGAYLLGFVIFLVVLQVMYENGNEYLEKKNDVKQPMTAIVYGKTAVQDLFGGTNYYALLKPNIINQSVFKLINEERASITKEVYDDLAIHDSIDGFNVNGKFSTEEDLDEEYFSFYLVFCLVAIYPVGYILFWLDKIKTVSRFFESVLDAKSLQLPLNILVWCVVTIPLLFGVFHFGSMLERAYDGYTAENKIETTAVITDRYKSINHKGSDSYYLTLNYQNQSKDVLYLTKRVSSHTYYQYDRSIPISYTEENLYEVSLQKLAPLDVFQILTTDIMIIYYLMFIIIGLLIYTLFLLRRKKKTGSYYKSN